MSVASQVPSRRFSLDEIRKATDDFNKSKIIGEGGFGKVYKGVVVDEGSAEMLVAVKRMNPESTQGIGEFETEIKILSKTTHCNVVHLVGYCNEDPEMILVYEYMSRGNLADHLYMNIRGCSVLTWEQRLKICIGAARGLDYLHSGTGVSERIIHLDVKSDNILLDDNWAAKIADLGLSKKGPANRPISEVQTAIIRGTPGYMDPRYLETLTYCRKADVYSFGVVLLEVLTGTSAWSAKIIPKPEVIDRADWIQQHISSQTLDKIIDSRVVSQIEPESLRRFAYTTSKTLQRDPEKRPSMSSVVAQLECALEFKSSSPLVDDEDHFPSKIVADSKGPCRRFSLDAIQKATGGFNKSNFIKERSFGKVYKGVVDVDVGNGSLLTQTLVAVKRLRLESSHDQGNNIREYFENEIKLLSKWRHFNLVNLVGYCNERQEMILVYEYMSQGSLANHLYRNQRSPVLLTWEQRLEICIGAARGLDFLHTGTGDRIIHFNVKSDNILLDDNWAAKIAGLGLSITRPPSQQLDFEVCTKNVGSTPGYVDPRFLELPMYTRKTDIYSFGVVLLEVLTGTHVLDGNVIPKPHQINQADWIKQHIDSRTLNKIIDSRVITQIHPECLKHFADIAFRSLQYYRRYRPSMSEVVASLESALACQRSSPKIEHSPSWLNSPVTSHNIFGKPIGDNTMLKMGLDSTRENKAKVAYKRMEHNNKYDDALRFVQDLNKNSGNGITTLCLLYNATGETLTYVTSHNQSGDIGPSPYPVFILNGQWGAYMHRKPLIMPTGSVGAVVYRGKYSDNGFCDRMVTWSNRITHANAAYCEINNVGYFDTTDHWDRIFQIAKYFQPEATVKWKDCFTMVKIESNVTPIYKAVFTYVDVPHMGNTPGRLHL